jgi:hypothetical protein
MKFKNRILKFTSKSNLTVELDFIDGRELVPNLDTDKIDRFYYSTNPTWQPNHPMGFYANSNNKDMLSLINEFDLHRNKEVTTYGELVGAAQDSFQPSGIRVGNTSLIFQGDNSRNFSGFKQFLHTKVEETKNGIETTRSTYWDLLVDLAERNIFIKFPVLIKAEHSPDESYQEFNIDIYIKFPTANKLKLYLVEKNIY